MIKVTELFEQFKRLNTLYEAQYRPSLAGEGKWPAAKTSYVLSSFFTGEAEKFANVMPAQIGDHAGVKLIYVDEKTGHTTAKMMVVDARGEITVFDAGRITFTRCGLMAALAIKYLRPAMMKPYGQATMKLGVVGYGKVGKAVETVLRTLCNVIDVRVVQSPRYGVDPMTVDLTDCDVVVTATTTRPEDAVLPWRDTYSRQVWLHFDSGYSTHSDFRRNLPLFADDHLQLKKVWADEFPGELMSNVDGPYPLTWVLESLGIETRGAAVALYGIGLADMVAAGY